MWCFAHNRTNCGKYLPWHLLLINLQTNCPEVHEYLPDRNLTTFGCIPMDQKIEETINEDIQTPGGKKLFSTKKMLYQGTT